MPIDIFAHYMPKAFLDLTDGDVSPTRRQNRVREIPALYDLDERFRIMDRFPAYTQVLVPPPSFESMAGPERALELACMVNEAMAELVTRHPERFVAFVAALPLTAPEAALRELERAIDQLGARGVQLLTNVNGRPLDRPEFADLFAAMAKRDLPICLHPMRTARFADYISEENSRFELYWVFGWPYETSVAMARLVFAGIFDKYPQLKIITHHAGGMIPFFSGRIGPGLDQLGKRTPDDEKTALISHDLRRRPFDYFRMFYADTALFGAPHGLRCAIEFFGADHILFGSDTPFDPEKGPGFIRATIADLDALHLEPTARAAIDEGNARRLLRL